jgi:hypothetical protein
MILDIIFVRHGLSCANVWSTKLYGSNIFYRDPELTNQGINTSKELSPILIKNITKIWDNQPYSIASSNMIRTQETAYYMLASVLNEPINIMPHICESWLSLDNYPLPKTDQTTILNEKIPALINLLEGGLDARNVHNSWNKSSFSKFLEWASLNPEYFRLGSDGSYRAVIFTHSHFIKNAFRMDKIINNNDAIHTIIDTSDKTIRSHTKLSINSLALNSIESCPDGCKISYCDTITDDLFKNLSIYFIVIIILFVLLVMVIFSLLNYWKTIIKGKQNK